MLEEIPGLALESYGTNPEVDAAVDKVNKILNFKGGLTYSDEEKGRVWLLEMPDGTPEAVITKARAATLKVLQVARQAGRNRVEGF